MAKRERLRREGREYEKYVVHPRFGQGPRYTGRDGKTCWFHHGHIAGTAIEADYAKQNFTTMGVTFYYDMKRICERCKSPFIFFAEEQKFWYEELQLLIDVTARQCHECRHHNRSVAYSRERYEELFHNKERTLEEDFEIAEHCLLLMEEGVFSPRKSQFVRMLIKRTSEKKGRKLQRRLDAFENNKL